MVGTGKKFGSCVCLTILFVLQESSSFMETVVELSKAQCVVVSRGLINDKSMGLLAQEHHRNILVTDEPNVDQSCLFFMDKQTLINLTSATLFNQKSQDFVNASLAVRISQHDLIVVTGAERKVLNLWVPMSVSLNESDLIVTTIHLGDLAPENDGALALNLTQVIAEATDNLHGQELTALFDAWSPYNLADMEKKVIMGGIGPDVFDALAQVLNFKAKLVLH